MAAVLGWGRGAVCRGVDRWLRGGLALIVGLLLVGTAQAQVDVSVKQSGNTVPQTPSANVMNVLVPITIGVAAVGAAAVAVPAVGALAITGDAVAAAGVAAIRSGAIQSLALVGLISTLGGDVSLDKNGNVVTASVSANAGDVGFDGYVWRGGAGLGAGLGATGGSPAAACSAMVAAFNAQYGANVQFVGLGDGDASLYQCMINNGYGVGPYASVSKSSSCVSGYVASGSSCTVDPNAAKQSATDTQLQNAIKAHPASWPVVYSDAGCSSKLVLTNVDGGGSNDPCQAMYRDSGTGFGVSFSTGGSSWANNGCAVNSTSCPSATVTTAPTTDTQTKTNADGSKTTKTTTTTNTTTVSGTNDRTNPVTSQTTTTTSTSTTTTNPDGSTTTTTETTTDQAPSQTATNTSQQQQDKQQPTTATFSGNTADLYKAKDKTFAQVLQGFVSRVQVMPWYTAMAGFFNVTISTGSCPHWAVGATRWSPALDMTPYVCSSTMLALYSLGGGVVLAVAAWAAFKIAFL